MIDISFNPFWLLHGVEAILSIECEIPSLKLVYKLIPNTPVEEECFLYLHFLDDNHRVVGLENEAHKKHVKFQYDHFICPQVFSEGNMILVYDQDHENIGARKFKLVWHAPYIVKCILTKGAYVLVDYEGTPLSELSMGSI